MAEIRYDADIDGSALDGRSVAIVGYGNQGRAHALCLRDTGVEVHVGARSGGHAEDRAREDGFEPTSIEEAVARADIVGLLLPDEVMADVYGDAVEPALRPAASLLFAHGFAIRFGQIRPRSELDVILAAPVGPGRLLRRAHREGSGIPFVVAVHQDASGAARATALAYAKRLGGGRAGIVETTFEEEVETDLFGEQAVIVGGVCALMEAGFDTLVDGGYEPELAYFECIHQMKLLVDMMYERGMMGMREGISKTALFGELTRGRRVVGEASRAAMREVLAEVQSGEFAREWLAEVASGQPRLRALLEERRRHPSVAVRERLVETPEE